MPKQLQCYHPEIGDQLEPPFVVFGTANAEVGPLYCGLFRGSDWFEGMALHPPANQARWAFEFDGPMPTGGGYSLWLGELTDSLPLLQLYPLSIFVPFAGAQLTVKYPPANRVLPANNVVAYGLTATPLNQHVLTVGGVPAAVSVLRNAGGRYVVQFNAGIVGGIANANLQLRNADAPMPSMVNRPVRVREV
jgi:hypothetical protein